MLLACHLDWLPGLHGVLPIIHLLGSLVQPGSLVLCVLIFASQRLPLDQTHFFQDQLLPLKNPCVNYSKDTCPFFFCFFICVTLLAGYPAFCVSQLAGNGKDLHGVRWACNFTCFLSTAYIKTDCKWSLYHRASKTGCISVVCWGWKRCWLLLYLSARLGV